MGLVYGQSFLTICALSSPDASVGLLGFSEEAPGGLPLDEVGITKDNAYVTSPSHPENVVHLLPYETREWTLQERLLAKRCLFFTATHIYFKCPRAALRSLNFVSKLNAPTLFGQEKKHRAWNSLPESPCITGIDMRHMHRIGDYCTLVEKYTWRQLTYPDDILNAFTAISLNLETFYSCRVKKGLLESVFSFALCWVGLQVLTRRVRCSKKPVSSSQILPSWSWCGWEGPVTFLLVDHYDPDFRDYLTYVPRFLLEEEGAEVTELTESLHIEHHRDAIRTSIPFLKTGYPAMLHFMAFCVTANAFFIACDGLENGLIYQNKGCKKVAQEQQNDADSAADHLGAIDEPCGGIQMTPPELLPLHGILQECKFILISTMPFAAYNSRIWTSASPFAVPSALKRIGDGEDWALNTLLIRKKNGFWERIGLAVFTQKAWGSADTKEEYIQLV
jgi:hypothetical protein